MIKTRMDYRLVQNIELANGQTRTVIIDQGLGDNKSIDRMLSLRDMYRDHGDDVDLISWKEVTTTNIIED
jgi:hypothetical protein